MSEEPTDDDLDEEEFIESSDEQYLNRSDDEQAMLTNNSITGSTYCLLEF
jgi:hypothetical protein